MEYLSSGKILIVDLASQVVSEEELSEDLVAEKIGGAGITRHLYQEHEGGDPVIVGTGLLTGTICPSAGLGVISGKSPRTGNLVHAPVTLHTAIELKYAGYDYAVIKGAASKPLYLWIHDGVADLEDASDVWGKDVWATTDLWRKTLGDDLIQTLVIGPAGESGSDYAQVCQNYWPTGDRFGLGRRFGEKKLKGIALRGMGLFEIADPEAFVDRSLEILQQLKGGAAAGGKGLTDILAAMGRSDVKEWLEPIVHRHSACFNTPFASNTFVYLSEDPGKLEETTVDDPGVLLNDPAPIVAMKDMGLDAKAACGLMKACARHGIDPVAVVELNRAAGVADASAMASSFGTLSGDVPLPGAGTFSPWCPQQPLFADFGASDGAWWERRQAVAYIFGLHPVYALMAPELSEDVLLELVNIGTEMEMDAEALEGVISDLSA